MKFKTLMMVKAIVCLVLGLPILLVPKIFYGLFGLGLTDAGVFPAMQYGASLLGNFMLTWYSRYARDTKARHGLILGMTVYNGIGFIVTLIALITGVLNLLGLLPIAIYLFFTIGFGYFLYKPPTP